MYVSRGIEKSFNCNVFKYNYNVFSTYLTQTCLISFASILDLFTNWIVTSNYIVMSSSINDVTLISSSSRKIILNIIQGSYRFKSKNFHNFFQNFSTAPQLEFPKQFLCLCLCPGIFFRFPWLSKTFQNMYEPW